MGKPRKKRNRVLYLPIGMLNENMSIYFSDLPYLLKAVKRCAKDEAEYKDKKEWLEKEKEGGFMRIEKKDGHSHVIWVPDFDSTITKRGVLVHECVHAAAAILEAKGIPLRLENDEILAYLTEYIFKESLSFVIK